MWHCDMCEICVTFVWYVCDMCMTLWHVWHLWHKCEHPSNTYFVRWLKCWAVMYSLDVHTLYCANYFIFFTIQHCTTAQCAVLHNAQCTTAQCNVQCTTMDGCWIMHYVAAFRTELKSCVRKDVMWPNLTFKVSVEHHKDWEERVRLMVCF